MAHSSARPDSNSACENGLKFAVGVRFGVGRTPARAPDSVGVRIVCFGFTLGVGLKVWHSEHPFLVWCGCGDFWVEFGCIL